MRNGLSGLVQVIIIFILFLFVSSAFGADVSRVSGDAPKVIGSAAAMPLAFTQNNGQWPDSILFRAGSGGATMWFMSSGIYYQFTRKISNESDTPQTAGRPEAGKIAPSHERPDSVETMLIKAAFIGASPNPEVIGEGLLDYKCNYFLGNDPAGWRTDVPNYTAIVVKNVYPGIDVRYSGDENDGAGYEFVAAPGADLSEIRIAYEGAEGTSFDAAGKLVVQTEWGNMLAAMRAPIESEGTVSGQLSLMAENAIAPEAVEEGLDNFNAASVQLSYSTYLGGEWGQSAYGIAVDTGGCAYVTGFVYSANFPTQNPFQSVIGGDADAFVTKFSSAGNSLIYSTLPRRNRWGTGRGYCSGPQWLCLCDRNYLVAKFSDQRSYSGGRG